MRWPGHIGGQRLLFYGMIRPSLLAALATALLASPLSAQQRPQGPEAPTAPVAVLTAALYNDQANLRETTDSAKAELATTVLRARLQDGLGGQLVPFRLLDSLATSAASLELTGGMPCQVKVTCARAVAEQTGARWIVLTKVSKTSNLIWLLSAQLIRASTGDIVLDDSTELKGDPDIMVRIGARTFADRVIRTVRNGGYATNFPDPPGAP